MALETITIKDAAGVDRKVTVDLHDVDQNAQVVKMGFAADGVTPALVSAANPLPVDLATRLQSDIDSISLIGRIPTYGGVNGYAAAAGDTFEISGSATKTIKVLQVSVVAYATAAGTQLILLKKRSTANTGGTANNVGKIPFDSADAASAADVRLKNYSAAPTQGTEVGIVEGQTLFCPASGTPAFAPVPYVMNFGAAGRKPIVLRGTAESLVVTTFSILSGLNLTIGMIWTEE